LVLSQAPALAEIQSKRRETHESLIKIAHMLAQKTAKNIEEHDEVANVRWHMTKAKEIQTIQSIVETSKPGAHRDAAEAENRSGTGTGRAKEPELQENSVNIVLEGQA